VVVGFMAFFSSCSEELDFDQFNALQVRPTLEASIFYVKAQESVINRINGLSFFTQDFNFDAFEEPFFAERVLQGSITYELENTTSKEIAITIEFLDASEAVLDTESFRMTAAPTALLRREVAYGPGGKSLDILRNTTTIRLNASNLGDNSSTSSLADPAVVLRSSGQFTLQIR
jgi:hypothetical protein